MPKLKPLRNDGLVRLSDIIGPTGLVPISRSSWYARVRDGRFPKPVKLGPRLVAWRVEEIHDSIEKLASTRE
jgi:predicted DNA-binding transcriptional regulator AlpA